MSALGQSSPNHEYQLGKDYTVRLFDGGFERWQQDEKTVVRWEDVQKLTVYEAGDKYEITLNNGQVLIFVKNKSLRSKVDWRIEHTYLLHEIEYQLVQHKLPTLLAKLSAGETLEFGDLTISQDGLQVGEDRLQWDKFSTMAYDEHRYGTKKRNPTPVQFYQHDTTRLWHSFAWSDLPNLAVLFNLVEQITHLHLWENQWDVALAERNTGNAIGIRHTLKFNDDNQRKRALQGNFRFLKWITIFAWVILVGVPLLALLNINWVEGWMLAAWCNSLICFAPLGLYAYLIVRRDAKNEFKYSTREIEISPERLRIVRGNGHEVVFRWRDVQYMESNLWFDGKTWLVGLILPFLVISTSPDPLDDEAGHAIDEHLSPEARALIGKTLTRFIVSKALALARKGETIKYDDYQLDANGIRSEEDFISWDDLRAKSTPTSIGFPEWASVRRNEFSSEYYAVVRHYLYG